MVTFVSASQNDQLLLNSPRTGRHEAEILFRVLAITRKIRKNQKIRLNP